MSTLNEFFYDVNKKYGTIGATSIIVKNNKIVNELTYGLADREENREANINTVFRIASISKLIVATATMTLVEKGIIDLDEDISKYLGFKVRNPKFPDKVINMKMIFTQTSSITDGLEDGYNSDHDTGYNEINGNPYSMVKLEDILTPGASSWVEETFSNYEPGTHWEYSNFGCGIQACIIERLTGIKFTTYVRENVLLPLGLDASFDIRDIMNPDVATLYTNRNGELVVSRTRDKFLELYIRDRGLGHNYIGPAGGLFINAVDLTKIMMMFMNDGSLDGVQILKKETMDRMLELVWIGVGDNDYVGKACQFKSMDYYSLTDKGPARIYGHFGGAYGLVSFMLFNPKQKTGFVALCNGGLFKYNPEGPNNLHDEMIGHYMDEFYNYDDTHHLEFVGGDTKAILDGRTINLKYAKPYKLGSKRPCFEPITMIDILSIPMVVDKKKIVLDLIEKLKNNDLFSYLSTDTGMYIYDVKYEEIVTNGENNLKFIIDYKPRHCTPRH